MKDVFSKEIHVLEYHDKCIKVDNFSIDTLQEVINHSKPGYVIYVNGGVYQGHISINIPYLTVIGEETILDGCGEGRVLSISAPFIEIRGFIITNGEVGIQLGEPDYIVDAINCCIVDNYISDTTIGINLSETEQNLIERNSIVDNLIGVKSTASHSNILAYNRVESNKEGFSFTYGSNWNKILNNSIKMNDYGVKLKLSHYNIVDGNKIVFNNVGVYLQNAISTEIRYNNISCNQGYGVFFRGDKPDLRYNWWGSRFGPSWLIPVFGDRVWGINHGICFPVKRLCYPWLVESI